MNDTTPSWINWDALTELARIAGPVGLVVIILGVFAIYLIQKKGWSGFGERSRIIATSRIDKIDEKLSTFDKRLSDIEHDLEDRPTMADFHKLENTIARLDERQKALEKAVSGVAAGVGRIEDFLYNLARDGK